MHTLKSPSGSSPEAPKFNVAFGDGDEDSIVVTTTDTALKAKAAADVSIKGVKADGTKVDITATFVKTGSVRTRPCHLPLLLLVKQALLYP